MRSVINFFDKLEVSSQNLLTVREIVNLID